MSTGYMQESTKQILEESGFNGFWVNDELELEEVEKLTRDMKKKIMELGYFSREDIKSLVNLYYDMQDVRKKFTERRRSSNDDKSNKGENQDVTNMFFDWVMKNLACVEKGIATTLEAACRTSEVGNWLLDITGIGPVLAAGLLASFDIEGKQYSSQFISYAGLNDNNRPWLGKEKSTKIINEIVGDAKTITDDMVTEIAAKTQWSYDYLRSNAYSETSKGGKWKKAELIKACSKIPYNADLKTLMWKVGKSFQWQCNNEKSLYGTLFSERRVQETIKNDNGEFANQAARILASKNIGKDTDAYKAYIEGKLPKAHITARAMRWTEKIFVSHLFEEMYRVKHNELPPRNYILEKDPMHNKNIEPEVEYHQV